MFPRMSRLAAVAAVSGVMLLAATDVALAQRPQYKIEPDGTVLKLKRINVTTFEYLRHGRAQLRRDAEGNPIWYFKAETGKEYTAPAPDAAPPPKRYTAAELAAAFDQARSRGLIPTALRVEQIRGAPAFAVNFARNDRESRWYAQVGMTPQEYEIVNRVLSDQGYRPLFAAPYLDRDRSTRFVAGWRH